MNYPPYPPGQQPPVQPGYPPPPPGYPPYGMPMEPARGGLILALGILGFIFCPLCGLAAWVMGNTDLQKINQGMMDPNGRSLTEAGKVCGIVSSLLMGLGLAVFLVFFVFAAGSVAVLPR